MASCISGNVITRQAAGESSVPLVVMLSVRPTPARRTFATREGDEIEDQIGFDERFAAEETQLERAAGGE